MYLCMGGEGLGRAIAQRQEDSPPLPVDRWKGTIYLLPQSDVEGDNLPVAAIRRARRQSGMFGYGTKLSRGMRLSHENQHAQAHTSTLSMRRSSAFRHMAIHDRSSARSGHVNLDRLFKLKAVFSRRPSVTGLSV